MIALMSARWARSASASFRASIRSGCSAMRWAPRLSVSVATATSMVVNTAAPGASLEVGMSVHLPRVTVPVGFAQLRLHDLARTRQRQRLAKLDATGTLVAGDLPTAMRDERLRRCLHPRLERDDRVHGLSPFGI